MGIPDITQIFACTKIQTHASNSNFPFGQRFLQRRVEQQGAQNITLFDPSFNVKRGMALNCSNLAAANCTRQIKIILWNMLSRQGSKEAFIFDPCPKVFSNPRSLPKVHDKHLQKQRSQTLLQHEVATQLGQLIGGNQDEQPICCGTSLQTLCMRCRATQLVSNYLL